MKSPRRPIPEVHLQPGEMLVTQEPKWVLTLLGSCVTVTMFNPRFGLAAICHGLLPEPRRGPAPDQKTAQCFRYLSCAIPAMIRCFSRLGLRPEEVEVKLFGGGNLVMAGEPDGKSIGHANVVMARCLLKAGRFRIRAQSVGGNRGCKIMFNTQTGEVLHKWLTRGASKP
jgi:chemotaxis protein CheD